MRPPCILLPQGVAVREAQFADGAPRRVCARVRVWRGAWVKLNGGSIKSSELCLFTLRSNMWTTSAKKILSPLHSSLTLSVTPPPPSRYSTWPGSPFQKLLRVFGPVRVSVIVSSLFAVTVALTPGEEPLPVNCTFSNAGRPPTSLK